MSSPAPPMPAQPTMTGPSRQRWAELLVAGRGPWYLTETRAFFACRAATWDAKFGDDLPCGSVILDVGCGTGRALPALRQAAGPHGKVIAVDLTPEMLRQARGRASAADAAPLQRSTQNAGWQLTTYDDAPHRFLAIAARR